MSRRDKIFSETKKGRSQSPVGTKYLYFVSFGVDDLDGTINDSTSIYSEAGSGEQNPAMTTSEMIGLITQVDRIPVERDSLYQPV